MSAAFPTADKTLALRRRLGAVVDWVGEAIRSMAPGPNRTEISAQLNRIARAVMALDARIQTKRIAV